MKTLSVIIPVFNEEKTIKEVIQKVENVELPGFEKQILIVDDGSTDATSEILKGFENKHLIIRHEKNAGKGAAIKTAIAHVKGEYTILQDADLELDPDDWPTLLKEIENSGAAAVYGSRYLNKPRQGYFFCWWGGKFLSFLTNLIYKTNLTDINTAYKLFRSDILKSLDFKAKGFEFCEEITVKLLKKKLMIKEIPIHYYQPRSFKEGKKIRPLDGLIGAWTIVKSIF